MEATADPATLLATSNPFARPRTNRQKYEFVWRQVLRLATYSIVIAVGSILAHIVWKGAPVVFTSKAPFINTGFLTKLPETLHVIEDKQGRIFETDPKGSDLIKRELGENMRSEKTIS